MADLAVIVPSRGRPEAARALVQHFDNTCTADTRLVFAIDADDPAREEYVMPPKGAESRWCDSRTMVDALNNAALWAADQTFAVAFMGDDHRPRTYGWDQRYLDALREMGTGIVYGDDLLQRENLPTQCAMTADIVLALGYMAPPTLRHMYVDNFWKDLGTAAECLRYLPDVVVEHMHPIAGKSEWTEGHKRVNAGEVYAHDAEAYRTWLSESKDSDVAKVKGLRHG